MNLVLLTSSDIYNDIALERFIEENHERIKLVVISELINSKGIFETIKRYGFVHTIKRGTTLILHKIKDNTTLKMAKKYNINYIKFNKDTFGILKIKLENFDGIVLSVGFNKIIPKEIVNSFSCYNIHRSLLPKYKGSNPVLRSYLAGEREFGITLHKMTGKVDSGQIICKKSFEVSENSSLDSINLRIAKEIDRLLISRFKVITE